MGLKIEKFSPSNAAIEKKTILIPDNEQKIIVEKIPIDITLKGSFINFGKLLESMLESKYRLTASNIEIIQKESKSAQTIKFISYAYFQTHKNKPFLKSPVNIEKIEVEKNTTSNKTNIKEKINVTEVVDKTLSFQDSIQNVPEMWLEPATEPINESIQVSESDLNTETELDKPKVLKKAIEPSELVTKKDDKLVENNKKIDLYEDFHGIEVLDSKICKKVKNNLPINPGKRFTTSIGKVFCHSLLNNNSGKHNDIYHIWYMNGELKAKVRIRVRAGKEIPAISHRVVESNDERVWKVEIQIVIKRF
jgi:DNA polymerase III, alpha subunit (gram-positive type)